MSTYTADQISKIELKLDSVNVENSFDEYLDETNKVVSILGMKYSASTVLKEVDPTAYRCCLSEYIDLEQQNGYLSEEINGEYYIQSEVDDLIEEEESN